MNYMYELALNDYKVVKKLLAPARLVSEIVDESYLGAIAYHVQQAYEKLIKAYMLAMTGDFPRVHNIGVLLGQANISHVFLSKYADVLSDWEVSTRYNKVHVDCDELQICLDAFQEVFKSLYVSVTKKDLVGHYIHVMGSDVAVEDVLPLLPETLPDDRKTLRRLIFTAISTVEDSNQGGINECK